MINLINKRFHFPYAMKTRFALLLIFLLPLAGCRKKDERHPEEAAVDVAYPMVDSLTLHKTYPGYIRAVNSADVVARVSGNLVKKHYTNGSYVVEGQPLFTIESSKYRDAVEQASASLQTAKSQYDYYSRQYAAMKKALEANAVSQIEVLQAESSMNEAKASIRSATAALQTAQTNLGYCVVRAPISGQISESTIGPGNYVNGEGGSVTLATIYDDSQMKAVFAIEDAQYEQMIGANGGPEDGIYRKVPLKFAQPLPHTYTADLIYTSPAVDVSTGTLTLQGIVANPGKELKDGMYVTVDLPYGVNPKAILVNDASIGEDQLGKYVYVVNDSDKVMYTPVEVGELYQDTLRIINKGIGPRDRYVTKALLTVRAGEKVKPIVSSKRK